jgi:Holliday junction resolvase RusA-like endonuclease
MIRLVIPGEVVPQLRPRFARRGSFVTTYDPEKCRNYKAYVRALAAGVAPSKPMSGPVKVKIMLYRYTPQRWNKAKIAAALAGALRPTTKPDITNLVKGIEDAIKGLIWVDDSQVVELAVAKWYSDNPRAEVEIDEISA